MDETTKRSEAAAIGSNEISSVPDEVARGMQDLQAIWRVVDSRQAVIEFDTNGEILDANKNFLDLMGYSLAELVGQHHRLFCDPSYASTTDYKQFWEILASGQHHSGEFQRFSKSGCQVWVQAFYSPVFDETTGQVVKVIKLASDITAMHREKLEFVAKIDAINRVQAVIEFDLNGIILAANDIFFEITGYLAAEVIGRHHRMFCEDSYSRSVAYRDFWEKLGRGEYDAGEYKRFGKNNKEFWLQASYNPILDWKGKPFKIVKYATDITEACTRNAEYKAKVSAIERSQAVVEFDLRGNVLDSNQKFLDVMGYKLEEIVGQHHRMFCDPVYASSNDYRELWEKLAAGHYVRVETRRLAKNNREVWVQGTYNPVLNREGQPTKIVKFATDITESKLKNSEFQGKLDAISKSQAVIEFDLEGNVLKANENFLDVLGYSMREIVGKHHSIFCDPGYVASDEYKSFWPKLSRGEFYSGRCMRIGKLGHRVWLQATYHPVLDVAGKPDKVVKFATDITAQVKREEDVVRKAMQIRTSNAELRQTTGTLSAAIQQSGANSAESGKAADSGARLVDRSTQAIGDLAKVLNEITDSVKSVGEVASQTNLLAFNAAIEAARAGEHGRGFAVVADEVRKLAERSSQATRDISRLLQESQHRIQLGNEMFLQAADSFRRIAQTSQSGGQEVSTMQATAQQQMCLTGEIADVTREMIQERKTATGINALDDAASSSIEGLHPALRA